MARLNLPSIAARLAIMPRLGAFAVAYPDIRLDLVIDMTDVVSQGFDAGVRVGDQISRDMAAVRLNARLSHGGRRIAVLRRNMSAAATPRDLTDHRCVTYKWGKTGALSPHYFDMLSQTGGWTLCLSGPGEGDCLDSVRVGVEQPLPRS